MSDRYGSQSFLGSNSQEHIERTKVGILGAGGGGSHVIQQLAHIGFQRYVICDPDIVEDKNLNRLVGATVDDVTHPKIKVARRVILGLQPKADVQAFQVPFEDHLAELAQCDIIFGCVDKFSVRRDIEAFCRRNLIPYTDIGIDVVHMPPEPPRLAGQVILSMPGHPCMQCLGFLNERTLALEAQRYGAAGSVPQVVWANGIVASIAVGLAVDLITDWTKSLRQVVYLSYDGNMNTVQVHSRMRAISATLVCRHYPLAKVGNPTFRRR